MEICVNDKATFKKACENAAWLTAELLKKHKLGIDAVVQHNRWSGKNCPTELRSGAWGVTWADFLAMVKKELTPLAPAPAAPAPNPAPTTATLYRVQVGAFSVKANAEALLAKLKAAGFNDAYIS